jgi:EAL domain-containing protein (putative c-di-GMP-specific phosphodiesterase class I)
VSAMHTDLGWQAAAAPDSAAPGFDLESALRSQQIEFWFQPKIDLREKRLAGVEAFARLPDGHGRIIEANELIAGASTREIVTLTEQALISALKASSNLQEIGVDARIAINVSVAALTRLPIPEIVQKYRPRLGKPVSLVFDVAEAEVLDHVDKMRKISRSLRDAGFSIAVDDFGAALLSIAKHEEAYDTIERTFRAIRQLGNVKFSEMKIDRELVRRCHESEDRQKVCSHIIKMARSHNAKAVAVGIETAEELHTLQALGCDIGQGFLFGKPMTEDEFLMMLWDRNVRAKQKSQAA